jgi:hypothetical protein
MVPMPHKEAFLVNFWSESGDDGNGRSEAWRGSVVQLKTQERRYFSNVIELIAFLTAHAGNADGGVKQFRP